MDMGLVVMVSLMVSFLFKYQAVKVKDYRSAAELQDKIAALRSGAQLSTPLRSRAESLLVLEALVSGDILEGLEALEAALEPTLGTDPAAVFCSFVDTAHRIIYDADTTKAWDEPAHIGRKAGRADDAASRNFNKCAARPANLRRTHKKTSRMPHARAHEERTHQFQAQEGAETEEAVGEVVV